MVCSFNQTAPFGQKLLHIDLCGSICLMLAGGTFTPKENHT